MRKTPKKPRSLPSPKPAVSKKTSGPRTTCQPSARMSSTAAISSTNTPMLLMRVMSFTPKALMRVEMVIMIVARTTPFMAKSKGPVPSPTNWKPDQSCGRVICSASATEPKAMMEESSRSQPASQDDVPEASRLAQL